MGKLRIIEAGRDQLDAVAALFDAYRVFYTQPSDPVAARTFIECRMNDGDSVIFLALDSGDNRPLGFAQLYPSHSSVAMRRLWILNDLYVDEAGRRRGVGKALIERARQHAGETGAKGLVLETAIDNVPAQKLYEQNGWVRDVDFHRYALDVRAKPGTGS